MGVGKKGGAQEGVQRNKIPKKEKRTKNGVYDQWGGKNPEGGEDQGGMLLKNFKKGGGSI